jgi:glycerol kinase
MQIQSDLLTISVHRPGMTEVTALGAAIAAGLATGVWDDLEAMQSAFGEVHQEDVFTGKLSEEERQKKWELWERGVERSLGWIKEGLEDVQTKEGQRRGTAE